MEFTSYVRLAKEKRQEYDDSWMTGFIDSRLEGQFNKNKASILIEIGVYCVEDARSKRPAMDSIVQVLADCKVEDASMHTLGSDI